MLYPLISILLQALPRHSEEGGFSYSVPRLTLIDTISSQHVVEPSVAENTVLLCERLLETLSVLDSDYLSQGEWRFVSFPAQLLATSILTALSDDESRLLPADFWNTQDTDNSIKDRQREVLRYIENARNDHHAQHQTTPIRYCYVAWSIIKLDGNILFYQREDTRKRHDKTHYSFKPWRTLKPYRQVQGAAPNHALTEYYLEIFQVELNLDGYFFCGKRSNLMSV